VFGDVILHLMEGGYAIGGYLFRSLSSHDLAFLSSHLDTSHMDNIADKAFFMKEMTPAS